MTKEEFYLPSKSEDDQLHVILWLPDKAILGVLQIVHGMMEYIDRYDTFATYLCRHGIAVIGHDHLGHGLTAKKESYLGFFHTSKGNHLLIHDIHIITNEMFRRFPHVPHFILGHSMGSFCTRKYLTLCGKKLDGAIIMGTGDPPLLLTEMGKALAFLITKYKGEACRCPVLEKITFSGYLKKIKNPRTSKDWLTRHKETVDTYLCDPLCIFPFTASAYHDLYAIISYDTKKTSFHRIPRTLPILFVSGEEDPVGNWGKGPKKLYHMYKKETFCDVSLLLYPGARHEVLNETNQYEVFTDLLNWINRHKSR